MTVSVRVDTAPGFSPRSLPSSGDWVALPNPVASYDVSRGRTDATGLFDAGTCTIVLDAVTDGLDPLVSGSGFYGADGAPGLPIRVVVTESGTDSVRFTGFIGPDGPTPTSDRKSRAMQVTVECYDFLGWAANWDLPDCDWSFAANSAYPPCIHLRGLSNLESTASASGSYTTMSVFDFGSYSIPFTAQQLVAGSNCFQVSSIVPGTSDPSLYTATNVQLVASSTLPASASDYSFAFYFQRVGGAGVGRDLANCKSSGNLRWKLRLNSTGKLTLSVYNSGGTLIDSVATGGSGYDDGNVHAVFAQVDVASQVTALATESEAVGGGGRPAGAAASAGTITLMPSQGTTTDPGMHIGGFAYWNSVFGGVYYVLPWDSTLITPQGSFSNLSHKLWGDDAVNAYRYSMHPVSPMTCDVYSPTEYVALRPGGKLGEALQRCGASFGGASYVLADGTLRLRRYGDLTNVSITAAKYRTELVNLTDEDSPAGSPPPVRYSAPSRTGKRTDRIVNLAVASLQTTASSGGVQATVTSIDTTSTATWGVRPLALDSDAVDVLALRPWTDGVVSAYANPVTEIGELTVDLIIDDNARAWALTGGLELETAVHYREATSDGAATPIDATYRVQHLHESFAGPDDWTLGVQLAPA